MRRHREHVLVGDGPPGLFLAGAGREGRAWCRRHLLVTVGGDAAAVERRLVGGRLACPGCAGVLAGWGHARVRSVRGWDEVVRLRPRRARCSVVG